MSLIIFHIILTKAKRMRRYCMGASVSLVFKYQTSMLIMICLSNKAASSHRPAGRKQLFVPGAIDLKTRDYPFNAGVDGGRVSSCHAIPRFLK